MLRLIVPLLVLLGLLAAVRWLDDPAPEADIVFLQRGDVFTLDPQRMTYLKDFRMGWALFEGLVRWDNETAGIVPAAAENLPDVSDDGLTYTFRILRDARWSNGEPLTADDFVYSFRRALTPETASYYSSLFFVVEGAREFFDWRAAQTAAFAAGRRSGEGTTAADLWREAVERFDESVGIRAVDSRTLEIRLAQPVPYFLDLLSLPIGCPVHPPTVERSVHLNPATGRREQRQDWAKAGRLISNGPYRLERWRFKRDMLLVRNEHHHSPQIMRNESVLAVSIDDPGTAVLAFESGGIDWLSDVSAEYRPDMLAQRRAYEQRHADEIARMKAGGLALDEALAALPAPGRGERRNIHAVPAFGVDFYSFNCRPTLPGPSGGRPNPFADAAVRRAFVRSIDREAIVRSVTRLNEPVVTGIVPPGAIPGYESPQGLGHDPARAREELRAAGWFDREGDGVLRNVRGEPFPVVEILWTTNTPRYRWISLELKSQWERTLGVAVEMRGVDTRFYREDLRSGNFMIARGTWYGDYLDPTTFLNLFQSDDGNNHRRYVSERVDDLLKRAARERDPAKRLRILEECERFLFQEEVPMLVICQLVQTWMYEPGQLAGLSTHPRLVQHLWRLSAGNREPQVSPRKAAKRQIERRESLRGQRR